MSFHQYSIFIFIFKATLNRRTNDEACGPSNNSEALNGERGVLTKKTFSLLFVLWGVNKCKKSKWILYRAPLKEAGVREAWMLIPCALELLPYEIKLSPSAVAVDEKWLSSARSFSGYGSK